MIVAAAIRQGELVCSVPRPGRHHDVIRAMVGAGVPTPIVGEQGFVTNEGRFVGRAEARRIAVAAGQGTPAHDRHLFSEDLW